ncbi:hypothetical protein HDU83_005469 [Entophlyctis luteolus]|nr:hypothetical protein HDU83_005469 [Entophlyctis luteolus]
MSVSSSDDDWQTDDAISDGADASPQVRYKGFVPANSAWTPPRVSADCDPRDFHARFVATRTPAIITPSAKAPKSPAAAFPLAALFAPTVLAKDAWAGVDALAARIGPTQRVEVETRDPSDSASGPDARFGSGRTRKVMTFVEFVSLLKSGDTSLYLSTQYNDNVGEKNGEDSNADSHAHHGHASDDDEEEEHGEHVHGEGCNHSHHQNDDEEDDDESENLVDLYADYCKAPLARLLSDIPLRPEILKYLIPQQMNMWMGLAPKKGVSSGLHHDFADNLYVLLQGSKKITLLPPSAAPHLKLYGSQDLQVVHENGLVSYDWAVGSDGSYAADVARWRFKKAVLALREGIKLNQSGEDIDLEPLRKDVVEAREEKLMAEEEENEEMHDFDSDDEDDADSEDNAEEGDAKLLPENSDDDSEDVEMDLDVDEMHDDFNDEEDDDQDPPMSFSRIDPEDLHAGDFKTKYPTLEKFPKVTFELKEGEMLYLPASWFHEIRSCPSASATASGPHVALNYWFHPPNALENPTNPYSTDFWADNWSRLSRLLTASEPGDAQPELLNDSAREWTRFIHNGQDANEGNSEVSYQVAAVGDSQGLVRHGRRKKGSRNHAVYESFDAVPVRLRLAAKNPGAWFMRSRKDGLFLGIASTATYI